MRGRLNRVRLRRLVRPHHSTDRRLRNARFWASRGSAMTRECRRPELTTISGPTDERARRAAGCFRERDARPFLCRPAHRMAAHASACGGAWVAGASVSRLSRARAGGRRLAVGRRAFPMKLTQPVSRLLVSAHSRRHPTTHTIVNPMGCKVIEAVGYGNGIFIWRRITRWRHHILLGGGRGGPMSRSKGVSALAWRSLCQMPFCAVGVELGLLREQGAGGAVHLHRDLVERAGRRVMRKADPRNVL